MATETVDTGSGDVTFLNGQAVEQETGGETHEGTDHGDELVAAKAAVKKVLEAEAKEEGRKAAKEAKAHREKDPLVPRDGDGKFRSSADPVEAEKEAAVAALKKESDDDASALRKALTERRELAKFKKEASESLEKERQEVRRVYADTQRQRQEVEAEKARIAQYRSRKDPALLAREAGYANPEDYILELAQEGTPEGQARRANRELLDRLDRAEQWQKQELAQREQTRRQQEEHQQNAYRGQVERDFLSEASKHDSLVGLYKGYEVELITQADTVAQQYRKATGQEATFAEIAEYIAERTEKWYKNRVSKNGARQVPSGSGTQDGSSVSAGSPTQGSATGKKRPISATGSERRSLGTSLADLDGDERREMAMSAVRAAIAASGER